MAYARGLHEQSDLPGGDFETHFSFAQALTESAKLAENCAISSACLPPMGAGNVTGIDDEAGG